MSVKKSSKIPIVQAPVSQLAEPGSLREYLLKIDAHAAKLGVDLNKKLDMTPKIADVNDPIKDGKLARLELFVMYLHARQEVLANYLVAEDEEVEDNTKEDDEKESDSSSDEEVQIQLAPLPPIETAPVKRRSKKSAV